MNTSFGQRTDSAVAFNTTEGQPQLTILDARKKLPDLDADFIKKLKKGSVVGLIVTLDTLEEGTKAIEAAGLKLPRMVSTDGTPSEDGAPLLGEDARTIVVLGTKQGNAVFNERYHPGVLNLQPTDPRPTTPGEGGVDRKFHKSKNKTDMIAYTLGELISIHSQSGDIIALDKELAKTYPSLSFLHRTRPPTPPPSPKAAANKQKKQTQQTAATNATTTTHRATK